MVGTIWKNYRGDRQGETLDGFDRKIEELHSKLRGWHRARFVEMDDQLQFCKKAILFFDRIEEKRKLDHREFALHQRIREKAFELSNNLEIRWHQRSRCNWLSNGDRNTRFFHAYASARARKNAVLEIEVNGRVITDPKQIRDEFQQHMKELLGCQVHSLNFDPGTLYQEV